MKRIARHAVLPCLIAFFFTPAFAAPDAPPKPKLILAIMIDQFRYDYLLRFRGEYTGGLAQLLNRGAVFGDAHYIQAHTVTAVGHSTFLTGATPSVSGIVGNEWFDREAGKNVTSVEDSQTKKVGGAPGAVGSSPRRLLVSTVGDEIKMQGRPAKVIGISIKDRSAILPAGHMADAAYWFDPDSQRWVTSSFYTASLPAWVREINDARPNARAVGASWFALDAKKGDQPFCSMTAGVPGVRYCGSLEAGPWGNEIIEDFAERALAAEKMGQHEATDLLAVSFSSNDYVGHGVGPDAPEVRDISKRTDVLLGRLLAAADRQVGLGNVMVVLSADHGVAPVPEVNQSRRMPGGRLPLSAVTAPVEDALSAKYGPGKWIASIANSSLYLDRSLMAKYQADEAAVDRIAAQAVRRVPHVFRVATAEELSAGQSSPDPIGRALLYGFYGPRSGNLVFLAEPYFLFDQTGTTHGTPFDYDTHVPVIFMGTGVKPGHYYEKITINDIAPTLAAIARTATPSGSIGRVLREMWE